VGPKPEICDGEDNDCDGQTDEDLSRMCASICGSGTEYCINGSWVDCDAPPSSSCLPDTDPGPSGPEPGDTRPCGSSIGECESGTQEYLPEGTWSSCEGGVGPTSEVCDGLDNDCDGRADESSETCQVECTTGTKTCGSDGEWSGCTAPGPSTEVCDGRDNDCDGQVDEVEPRPCSSSCGSGTESCVNGRLKCDAPTPEPETCDDVDNDCDGQVDENLSKPCEVICPINGASRSGTQECANGSYEECIPDIPCPN
jgi:hypothetical protein